MLTASQEKESSPLTMMVEKRPKLLFLAWIFPPLSAPGSVRTWNLVKYLRKLGWDITVVTPHPSVIRHLDASEETDAYVEKQRIDRILTGHRWCCLAPYYLKCWEHNLGWIAGGVCRKIARHLRVESDSGWIKPAEKACLHLTPDDVDAILVTGPPFGAFSLAKRLSARLGRPYILDYRDPWTGNPHANPPANAATFKKEANLLADSSAITIVSPSWGLALDRRFGVGPKLHVITNGYDPEEMTAVKPYDFGHCALVYTGTFIPPKRTIAPFFAALDRLKDSLDGTNNEWRFHYYGVHEDYIREQAARFNLTDRIVLHGKVSRAEALSAVKGASLAVVITSIDEQSSLEDRGIVTGKIFEAIGLGAPIVLITPAGSDAAAITEGTGLVKSYSGADIDGMALRIKEVISGQIPEPKDVEACAWTIIAKKLDVVLREVIVDHTSSRENESVCMSRIPTMKQQIGASKHY